MTDAEQEGKAPKIWIKKITTTIRLGLAAGEEHGPITLDQNQQQQDTRLPHHVVRSIFFVPQLYICRILNTII